MIVIKGENLNVENELFDHVKITSENLIAALSRMYLKSDCDFVEEFLDYLKGESILVYIEKKGVC